MKTFLVCSVLLVAVLCTVYGADGSRHRGRLSPVAAASIRNGITTRGEVQNLLGPPREIVTQVPIRQPKGTATTLPAKYTASEIWDYWVTAKESRRFPFSADGTAYAVIVYFDDRGVVLDCVTEGH